MKSELRTFFKNQDLAKIDDKFQDFFISSLLKFNVSSLGLYSALSDEINILDRKVFSQWKISLPFLDGQRMRISIVEESILEKEISYNLQKKFRGEEITPELIVVPGIAFDYLGYRLGRGGGFYDRYLSNYSGELIGLSYHLTKQLPVEEHDKKVNYFFNINTNELIKVGEQ